MLGERAHSRLLGEGGVTTLHGLCAYVRRSGFRWIVPRFLIMLVVVSIVAVMLVRPSLSAQRRREVRSTSTECDTVMAYVLLPQSLVPVEFSAATGKGAVVAPGKVNQAIPVPNGASALALTADGRTAYVAGSDGLTPINLVTRKAGPTIPLSGGGSALALTPDGRTAYVAGSDGVTPINLVTRKAGPTIVLPGANDIVVDGDGKTAFVTTSNSVNRLSLREERVDYRLSLDNQSLTRQGSPYAIAPYAIALTPDGTTAFVTMGASGLVERIDLTTMTVVYPNNPIMLTQEAYSIVIAPNGGVAYVASGLDYVSGASPYLKGNPVGTIGSFAVETNSGSPPQQSGVGSVGGPLAVSADSSYIYATGVSDGAATIDVLKSTGALVGFPTHLGDKAPPRALVLHAGKCSGPRTTLIRQPDVADDQVA